jgi:hypothetical protein
MQGRIKKMPVEERGSLKLIIKKNTHRKTDRTTLGLSINSRVTTQ